MTHHSEPIACRLPMEEGARQALEWRSLLEHSVGSERIANGIAVTYPSAMGEAIKNLAAREQECCNFLDIVVNEGADAVTVIITSGRAEARPAIEMLVGS